MIKRSFRKIRRLVDSAQQKLAVRNGLGLYVYAVSSLPSIWSEHLAVTRGKVRYLETLRVGTESVHPDLRRNIHRLEKGLISSPRKRVFAEEYIRDTVKLYGRALSSLPAQSAQSSASELKWARDVLNQYFGACGASPAVTSANTKFRELPRLEDVAGVTNSADQYNSRIADWSPFETSKVRRSTIKFDELMLLAQQRRSVRRFSPDVPSSEVISDAISLAYFSPSACNRQSFRFIYLEKDPERKKMLELAIGGRGFAEALPGVVVVVGDLSGYVETRDRHLIYIDGSLASMSFMYALETKGLSSCALNWPDIPERNMAAARLLGLKPFERIVMQIAVGSPAHDALTPYSQKKCQTAI